MIKYRKQLKDLLTKSIIKTIIFYKCYFLQIILLVIIIILFKVTGTSLVVQWLRLCAPNAGGLGTIPGQGTGSHMQQLRHSAAKEMNKYLKIIYSEILCCTTLQVLIQGQTCANTTRKSQFCHSPQIPLCCPLQSYFPPTSTTHFFSP